MSKKPETAQEWADTIPEDMRGHVFHALGKMLGHSGGAQPNSGDAGPPPPKPKNPDPNN